MKKLFFSIFLSLLSTQSFSSVGDLYNCKETSALTLSDNGAITNLNSTLSNFSFRRNSTEIIIESPITTTITSLNVTSSKDEEFTASSREFEYLTFKNGIYINTTKVIHSDSAYVMTIIAKCRVSKL